MNRVWPDLGSVGLSSNTGSCSASKKAALRSSAGLAPVMVTVANEPSPQRDEKPEAPQANASAQPGVSTVLSTCPLAKSTTTTEDEGCIL